MSNRKLGIALLAVSLSFFAVGCKKTPKVAATTPANPTPPPPPPEVKPAPAVRFFSVEPSSITAGQSATIRWAVEPGATVTITGMGNLPAEGSRSVSPSSTTTYRLSAVGPGGTTERSVTLNVAPAPPPDRPAPPSRVPMSISEMVTSMLTDLYFDYDQSDVREDDKATLNKNAEALKSILNSHPNGIVTIEGHCDERGSAEYNLGLGDRRSSSTKEYLVNLGVPADKLKVISYGKEKPACSEASESCFTKNRRAHFSAN